MILSAPTGIGRVVECTLAAQAALGVGDDYTLICRPGALSEFADRDHFLRVETETGQYSPRVFTRLPRLLNGSDLAHFYYFVHPYRLPMPYVVSIFDTVYSVYPSSLSPVQRAVYETTIRMSVRCASLILTDSQSAKSDIVRYFGPPEEKVRVIPLGVESRFSLCDVQDIIDCRRRYGLPDQFILYVGNHKPHKNVRTVVDALALVRNDTACSLVLLDDGGEDCRRTRSRVQETGMTDRVIFLRELPEADLPLMYNAADLFVFPSLYEGFGLPPLEAMACGTPVVTSNTSALPEVVGDAGIMVDPTRVDELADAMLRVLRSPDLRSEMTAKGLERARKYTWEETARQTRKAYEEVYDRTRG